MYLKGLDNLSGRVLHTKTIHEVHMNMAPKRFFFELQPDKLLRVLTLPSFHWYSLQTRRVSMQTASSTLRRITCGQRKIHGLVQSKHQQQFSINVWAGNVGD
jgi:hypothetical protein